MPKHRFQPQRSYRILETPGRGNAYVGRLLRITKLGPDSIHLPESSIICSGTIQGFAGEIDFPGGVRLQEPFTTCYCTRWPFPHKWSRDCREEPPEAA